MLTQWGQMTHVCFSKLTTTVLDDGLSTIRCRDSICSNAGILWIRNLRTNISEILNTIRTFSPNKMHLKMGAILSGPLNPCLLYDWSNHSLLSANLRNWLLSLVYILDCRLFCTKPLSEPIRIHCESHSKERPSIKNVATDLHWRNFICL